MGRPRSAAREHSCREDRNRGWPLPELLSEILEYYFWMKPPQLWTLRVKRLSKTHLMPPRWAVPPSPSPTDCPPSRTWTWATSLTTGRLWSTAAMRNCSNNRVYITNFGATVCTSVSIICIFRDICLTTIHELHSTFTFLCLIIHNNI